MRLESTACRDAESWHGACTCEKRSGRDEDHDAVRPYPRHRLEEGFEHLLPRLGAGAVADGDGDAGVRVDEIAGYMEELP